VATRAAMPVDALVGQNIRILRLQRGLSQSDLGRQTGLSYQQIQKYEIGANRLGASRLSRIAEVLQVPILALFDGSASADQLTRVGAPSTLLAKPHAVRLLQAFANVQSIRVRVAILNLVAAVGGHKSKRQQRGQRHGR
jgi:transcriptional regulator with XRE-family HTH domain